MKEDTKLRIFVTIIGIFVPPLAVLLLYGFGADFLLNCVLAPLGFFPATIHQMCLDMSYWNRRKRVRQGRFPGERHSWIFSKEAQRGGASERQFARLRERGKTKEEAKADEKHAKKKRKAAGKDHARHRQHSKSRGRSPSSRNRSHDRPRPGQPHHRSLAVHEPRSRERRSLQHDQARHVYDPRDPNTYDSHYFTAHDPRYPITHEPRYPTIHDSHHPVAHPHYPGLNDPRYSDKYDPNGIYGPPGGRTATTIPQPTVTPIHDEERGYEHHDGFYPHFDQGTTKASR